MCIARTGAIPIGNYFFLCLFFLKRFLRLWVAILLFFLFFPLGIVLKFFPLALKAGLVKQLF